MKNTVILKGNRYGISVVLDDQAEFEAILSTLKERLDGAEEFFDSDKQLAITFEGRDLSNEELDQLLGVIREHSKLNIQYVMDENSDLEATFYDIIQTAEQENDEEISEPEPMAQPVTSFEEVSGKTTQALPSAIDNNGMFYRGTLRSGQCLESKSSVVVVGDVNPGASILSEGNIVVIGALKGTATAGRKGDRRAFVLAITMEPIQIQIADVIARGPDKKGFRKKKEPMIATIVEDKIVVDAVSQSTIQDII